MVDAVGQDFGNGLRIEGADAVNAATIRRYLEPLEFDCALHHDAETARAHGYADIIAPNTSVQTFSLPPMWQPGQTLFTSGGRDAQPSNSGMSGIRTPFEPPTTGYFATDYEVDYFLPVHVGDRLHRFGARLLACTPKETKVGRGAFLTWECDIRNQHDALVARIRTTILRYNPPARDQ